MKIIGLRGKSRSGKNTLAAHLVEHHGFFEIALADPMKRFIMDTFGINQNLLWGHSSLREVEIGPALPKLDMIRMNPDGSSVKVGEMSYGTKLTPRRLLQTLGTEWGRAMFENVWINYALKTIAKMSGSEGYIYDPTRGVVVNPKGTLNRWRGAVITDVRFDNESAVLRDEGATVVYIDRPSSEADYNPHLQHASEHQVRYLSHERLLVNDTHLDGFKAKGVELLKDVLL